MGQGPSTGCPAVLQSDTGRAPLYSPTVDFPWLQSVEGTRTFHGPSTPEEVCGEEGGTVECRRMGAAQGEGRGHSGGVAGSLHGEHTGVSPSQTLQLGMKTSLGSAVNTESSGMLPPQLQL